MKLNFNQTLILLLALFMTPVLHAEATLNSVENQYDRIHKLLNESSGARQILTDGSKAAKSKRSEALDLHKQARKRIDAQDLDGANRLLNQSAKTMFEAIRLASYNEVTDKKKKNDYATRKESVVALRDAFNRISDENKERTNKEKTNKQVVDIVATADAYFDSGDIDVARQELDKAYHLLKVSIEYIRAGQTLVRSLEFANAREEYAYELDRNETHSMLVSLLVSEKKKSKFATEKIEEFVAQAKALREQADAYANERQFEKAIELLEDSTRQLVRAIRVSGVFIPG